MAVALLALVAWIYAPVRAHEFVRYDDGDHVYENPLLSEGLTWRSAGWAFTKPQAANWTPATTLSFQLSKSLVGLEPHQVLLTNVALHGLAAVLLFLGLAQLTGAAIPSAFTAAVFAVHPLHVESVAWASERRDVLAGVFFGATLLAYARFAARPSVARYGGLFASVLLGMLSKPTFVTVPCVLLLLDVWPLGRLSIAGRGERRVWLEKVPLFALAAGLSALTAWAQNAGGATGYARRLDVAERVSNALESYATYLVQALWPAKLAVFYPHPEEVRFAVAGASALLLLGISALAWHKRRDTPAIAVGWLWYLGMLVPMIGLVQVGMQARADRYTYFPLTGACLALFFPLAQSLARRGAAGLARGVVVAGLVAVLALAVTARRQVGVWANTRSLFEHALAVAGPSAAVHQQLGGVEYRAGQLAPALRHYGEAAKRAPGWAFPILGLGEVLSRGGESERAKEMYRKGLTLDRNNVQAHVKLGLLELRDGETASAVALFERGLALLPAQGDHRARGVARMALGDLARQRGDLTAAVEHYRRGLAEDPTSQQGLDRLFKAEAALRAAGKTAP